MKKYPEQFGNFREHTDQMLENLKKWNYSSKKLLNEKRKKESFYEGHKPKPNSSKPMPINARITTMMI